MKTISKKQRKLMETQIKRLFQYEAVAKFGKRVFATPKKTGKMVELNPETGRVIASRKPKRKIHA